MSKELMGQPRKRTGLENIMASYMDERAIKLTESEEDRKACYEATFTMLIKGDGVLDTVKKIMKLYDVSSTTAYRYIREAETIFGSVKQFNKDAWRFIQVERKRKLIKKLTKAKNWKLVVKLESDIDKLLGFDKEDLAFDPEKIASQNYDIVISESLRKALEQLTGKGVVDMNKLEIEDIPHEEVAER